MRDRLVSIALFASFPVLVYFFHHYTDGGLFLGQSAMIMQQVAAELALPAFFLVVIDWFPAVILSMVLLLFVGAFCFKEKPQPERARR